MRNNSLFIWLLINIIMLECPVLMGQTNNFNEKNPEEQFAIIQQLAFNKKYSEARKLGRQVLDSIPNYHDVSLLLARTYLWENKFDSASILIDDVLKKDPDNIEAKEAQLDMAYFSKNMQDIQNLAPNLIKQDPENIPYREKYAIALLSNNQNTLAGKQADSILSRDSLNTVALDIKEQLAPKKQSMELTLGYSFDHFSEPYLRWWHLYTVGLRKPTSWGSLEGRVNYGHLYSSSEIANEIQLEAESYINLTKSAYMMLLYGYSPHTHFPNHRAAIEVWHKLPKNFIVSLGLNYYHWDDNDIFIGTGSLEKYLGKYWLCFRAYVHIKDVGVSGSYYFTGRRYFNDIDYFQVTLGLGTAPDEPFDIKTDLERLNAYSVRFLMNKKLSNRWKMRAGLGYAYEEFRTDTYRNRFDGTISFIYSFGK